MRIRLTLIIMAVAVLAATASAVVTPVGLISDNAVLQQGMRVPIWGTADDGEKISVEFQGQKVSTIARNGPWIVWLRPLKAGGPYTMRINDLEIRNVLVGEVWICSGQSNMAWQMSKVENSEAEIEAANDPMLRLYSVPKLKDPTPMPRAWKECTPESATSFSAVGYYFGKHLRERLGVPVGLIDSSVGGTPAESWTSSRALSFVPELKYMAGDAKRRPGYLYRAMIQPLQPHAFKGAIWYQGEANASRAYEYRTLLPTMIKCWRNAWAQGDFAFLIVQLAPYNKNLTSPTWPELREAQCLTAQTVPNTGIVVITDYGNCENIHPTQKKPVGERLGLAARGIAYAEKIVYSGPIYKSLEIKDDKAIISFCWSCTGLMAKDGELRGFTIAGEDQKFVPARAEIVGKTVVVSSPEVPKPVAVRYGWENCPDVNLLNGAGLPASPFRTDCWPMITKPE